MPCQDNKFFKKIFTSPFLIFSQFSPNDGESPTFRCLSQYFLSYESFLKVLVVIGVLKFVIFTNFVTSAEAFSILLSASYFSRVYSSFNSFTICHQILCSSNHLCKLGWKKKGNHMNFHSIVIFFSILPIPVHTATFSAQIVPYPDSLLVMLWKSFHALAALSA